VVPNLAVEINSPSNEADQLARKRRQYFRYGVEEVWIIYPEERVVEVYDAHGMREYTHADRLTLRLLAGMEIDLAPLLPLVEPPAA
jgi:Uma2 family endonuclease